MIEVLTDTQVKLRERGYVPASYVVKVFDNSDAAKKQAMADGFTNMFPQKGPSSLVENIINDRHRFHGGWHIYYYYQEFIQQRAHGMTVLAPMIYALFAFENSIDAVWVKMLT